uniref:Uncharacterized protein n=1 Tax=Anguilla anguilla TaxID=7936 RepID=A0A0E9UL61_ANGAN
MINITDFTQFTLLLFLEKEWMFAQIYRHTMADPANCCKI